MQVKFCFLHPFLKAISQASSLPVPTRRSCSYEVPSFCYSYRFDTKLSFHVSTTSVTRQIRSSGYFRLGFEIVALVSEGRRTFWVRLYNNGV
ncbi:hypothetical protein BDW59DRAFT_127072 [Aspergillus cavernicola]|uniref:Uncharacterized protein n=1 Tax=Aspergillus cavernicola TaxID=176166 RepID=A0ABR4HTE2_9EURO